MSGPPIEVVLLRQVAGYLATPLFFVDEDGNLEYYNEPAEALLGRRYEETGQMPLDQWGPLWKPTDADGQPIAPEEIPVTVALRDRKPTQGALSIRGLDGVLRQLTITALPLEGADGSHLGAFAIFWESSDSDGAR